MIDKHPDYTPYAYVYNNPLIFIDPLGLDTFRVNIDDRSINRITVENSESHVYIISGNGNILRTYTLAINDNGLVQFPSSGEGFGRYGTVDEGGDHYLNSETAAAMFGLTMEMKQEDSDFRIDLGDMSNETGSAPGGNHKTHGGPKGYSGDCIDYRYLNSANQSHWGLATGNQFSLINNYNFLNRASSWGFTKNYISNKPGVWSIGPASAIPANAKRIMYHNNHGHITYIK